MGVFDDMAQQARMIAKSLAIDVPVVTKVFLKKKSELHKTFDTQLDIFVRTYKSDESDAAKYALDAVHDDSVKLVSDIRAATKSLQTKVASADELMTGIRAMVVKIKNKLVIFVS